MKDYDLIKDFLRFLEMERGLSENTREAYYRDVLKLHYYLNEAGLSFSQVTFQQLQEFLVWLNSNFAIAASSQGRIISGLKSFFGYLQIEELREDNPSDLLETPRISRKIPKVLTIVEIDALFGAIDHSTPEGIRNRALLEVLYGCGLRVSEITNLKLSSLFLDVEFIQVSGKGDKERIVPIGKTAIKHLTIYLNQVRPHLDIKTGMEDFVFLNKRGSSLSRVMVFIIIKNLAKEIGLKKNISPHTFRHSFASHLVEAGADLRAVQDMLGHESITTTEIYTHLDKDYLQSVITSFHPRS